MKKGCAYYRTSSQTNVGSDKDSERRQQDAVRSFAARNGIEIVAEYYDAAVSGADPVDARPEFCRMVSDMLSNGACAVLVENASRFARDLIVQETGYRMLRDKNIELIAVDSPESFVADTPTAEFIRQVLGAVAQLEKAMLVSKLRAARDRVRAAPKRPGRVHPCEGNPAWVKGMKQPRIIPQAAWDRARAARARGLSLRQVGDELAAAGFLNVRGKPFAPQSVRRMVLTEG